MWSERYSFFAVGPKSLNREIQIVSILPAYQRPPRCHSFLSCRPGFPSCGWQSESYFWREMSSRTRARLRFVQFNAYEELCCTELMAVLDPVKVIPLLYMWRDRLSVQPLGRLGLLSTNMRGGVEYNNRNTSTSKNILHRLMQMLVSSCFLFFILIFFSTKTFQGIIN